MLSHKLVVVAVRFTGALIVTSAPITATGVTAVYCRTNNQSISVVLASSATPNATFKLAGVTAASVKLTESSGQMKLCAPVLAQINSHCPSISVTASEVSFIPVKSIKVGHPVVKESACAKMESTPGLRSYNIEYPLFALSLTIPK